MKRLHISDELALPLEAVTQKFGHLGVTGSGKTFEASKLAEEMLDAGAQIVVLDPVGTWWALRLAKDGKTPSGFEIPIFGGLHGDVPLEHTAGALIANLVVDRGISVVLDVSQFESDAQKARFATDFAERFFFRKKAAPSAVHLFIEECQEFVPQNTMRGEEKMLHAFTRLQKLGRNFGIGSSYITQRPQEVNKKALNMAQTLFVFRTTGSQERAAIEKWIEDKALDQDIAGDLPKLATGSCHVWSPEFLGVSKVVRILPKRTFNASSTPEVGAVAKARTLAPIDLERIRGDIAATIERAKADDPMELRKQISELKRDLAKAQKATNTAPAKVVEKPVLKDAQIARVEKIIDKARMLRDDLAGLVDTAVKDSIDGLRDAFRAARQPVTTIPLRTLSQPREVAPPVYRGDPKPRAAVRGAVTGGAASLSKMGRAILTAFAQHPDGLEKGQALVFADYRRSGDTSTFYATAAAEGWLEPAGGQRFRITDVGLRILGSFDPLPTGSALREQVLNSPKLSRMEREIMRVAFMAHPNAISKGELIERAGYRRSGDTSTAFAKFNTMQWLTQPLVGHVRASDTFFEE